jgi:hypothetical protein
MVEGLDGLDGERHTPRLVIVHPSRILRSELLAEAEAANAPH